MKLAIIGTGLIGGSLALKAKTTGFASRVVGIDRDRAHLETAVKLNIIDEAADLDKGVADADLIILAVPVDAATLLLPKILEMIGEGQTVMDVGSTKSGIAAAVKNHPNRHRFVAFHPMWGTENSGPAAATAASFANRAAVICDREFSASDALETIERLAKTLEMNLLYMDSAAHDLHTAYISHISHITSYALANTVLEREKEEDTIFQLASSGFSSTVRLAKSHPEMWVPIFRQNRENVLDVLNEHISQLRKFKSALEKENYDFLEELIRNANRIRPILEEK